MKNSFINKLAILVLFFAASYACSAQTITLKLHHFLPASSTAHVNFMVPWCKKIEEQSAGKMKCQIYPSMQMGGTPQQLFDQAKDGVADIVWTVPGYQAGRFPITEAFELPFMIYSSEKASRGLWNYANKNALGDYKGVKPILFHVHDGSLIHSTKIQVKTLEDFKGLRVRAPTRQSTKMAEALGATPVPMPLPQAADALSKGVIDGAIIPWEVVPAMKFQEITKFHTEMPVGGPQMSNTVFILAMNQARYDSLPPELKKIIDANSGAEPSAWVGKIFAEDAAPGRKSAEVRHNNFYTLPAAEWKRWEKATASVADEWVKDMNAKGLDGKRLLEEAKAASR